MKKSDENRITRAHLDWIENMNNFNLFRIVFEICECLDEKWMKLESKSCKTL